MLHFSDFNLGDKILKALKELGYETPTPIQAEAIPKALAGSDLIASAQTGTGKTAAFMLPTLHLLTQLPPSKGRGPRILVLVPTRELAIQVAKETTKFCKHLPQIKIVCIYGGVPYPPQNKALNLPHDILIATPGRLIDQMTEGRVSLDRVKFFILDEADRMLDMGFSEPVKKIAAAIPEDKQTLLFSATIDQKIVKVSQKMQKDPVEIRIAPSLSTKNSVEQRLYLTDNSEHKMRLLDHLLAQEPIQQAIIFTAKKREADALANTLREKGYRATALHGDLNQRQRTRTIERFHKGQVQLLVATDVAARGLDVASLSHVINMDPPYQLDDYVHRIGRTGRAGATGVAMTFVVPHQVSLLSKMAKAMGSSIQMHTVPGCEPKSPPKRDFSPRNNRPYPRNNKNNGPKGGRKGAWRRFAKRHSF